MQPLELRLDTWIEEVSETGDDCDQLHGNRSGRICAVSAAVCFQCGRMSLFVVLARIRGVGRWIPNLPGSYEEYTIR